MYIAFEIVFPKELSPEATDILRNVLPNPNLAEDIMDDDAEVEDHYMEEADLSNFGKGGAVSSTNEYDSDEEGNGAGGGVQCQQS